jgi:hypothetical protein
MLKEVSPLRPRPDTCLGLTGRSLCKGECSRATSDWITGPVRTAHGVYRTAIGLRPLSALRVPVSRHHRVFPAARLGRRWMYVYRCDDASSEAGHERGETGGEGQEDVLEFGVSAHSPRSVDRNTLVVTISCASDPRRRARPLHSATRGAENRDILAVICSDLGCQLMRSRADVEVCVAKKS